MTRCCVLLAPGFEEIEAVTVIDVLRRAGVDVTTLAVADRSVEGSHGIRVEADARLADHADESWDLVVLPGGMPGSAHLRDDPGVQALVKRQHAASGRVAAICAAPIALASAGILAGRRATSYPGFGDDLGVGDYSDERVVVDGAITTSRGPGTALEFAMQLVEQLVGAAKARELGEGMIVAGAPVAR